MKKGQKKILEEKIELDEIKKQILQDDLTDKMIDQSQAETQ